MHEFQSKKVGEWGRVPLSKKWGTPSPRVPPHYTPVSIAASRLLVDARRPERRQRTAMSAAVTSLWVVAGCVLVLCVVDHAICDQEQFRYVAL